MLHALRYDLRAALRLLTRRPGYCLLAVLTLAVGLGVNTVAFSAVNGLLFRSTRIARGEEIGWLSLGTQAQPYVETSLPMFERVRRDATTLRSVVAEGRMALAYETGAQTDQIWALVVSPDYFSTVHVPLAFGRTWRADEAAPGAVAILVSERFWRARLGGSRDLSALALTVNRQIARVVGVVRDDFEDPGGVFEPDVFVPLTARDALGLPKTFAAASTRWLTVIARPRPGATADAIQADVLPLVLDEAEAVAGGAAADDVRVSYVRIADGNPSIRPLARLAMRIPMRSGRAFTRDDGPEAVVVNDTAAAQFWPGRSPLGEIFREGPDARARQVVGVVADVTQRSFSETPRPHFYQTLRDAHYDGLMSVVVRTAVNPRDLILPMRDAAHAVEPSLPVQSAQTMRERMALPLWLPRTVAGFFGVCGVVAVLLATVGLFGVTYFVVMQRTREFGVRLALGATGSGLRRLVVGEALRLVTPGIALGTFAAVAAGLAARSLLFGVTAASPATYVVAAGAQWLVAVAASWIPAIRAARVDPLAVLRSE